MKKLFLTICLLVTSSLPALPVGNPDSPGILTKGIVTPCRSSFNIRVGYEGSFVFDRRLKQYEEGTGIVDEFHLMTNAGTVTANFFERMDLFAILGTSHINAVWPVRGNLSFNRIKTESDDPFAWSVGTNILLLKWNKTVLGVGGRYFTTDPVICSLKIDGVEQDVQSAKMFYHEWQANLGIAYEAGFLVPYIGFQYTQAYSKVEAPFVMSIARDEERENHFKTRNPYGLYLGCSVVAGKIFFINVEARLLDEEAVSVSADLRF